MNYAIYPLIFDGSIQSLVNYPPLSDLDLFQWQIFGGHIYFPNPWLAGPSYNFSGRQGIAINLFYGMLNLQFL